MKRSKNLETLLKLAKNRERSAAEQLGKQISEMTLQEKRLSDLEMYRLDYQQRLNRNAQGGIPSHTLQTYFNFIRKIDTAINQQKSVINKCRNNLIEKRQLWQEEHAHTKAITITYENLQSHEKYEEDKKEQKELDDRANNRTKNK
ncbi:MAG: flagellar export protein FliJ [Pseudomonadota bacterium]